MIQGMVNYLEHRVQGTKTVPHTNLSMPYESCTTGINIITIIIQYFHKNIFAFTKKKRKSVISRTIKTSVGVIVIFTKTHIPPGI